ncbi:MarR family winged helix-turn-helix transcriptional regulator [Paenisporosarcina sp. OV554]|uniref:MarR family winged helix-turn-helix transcriptional regulator n=1 Tax=Paenisporosarcina sp. OV554 TaxID=2135694 RepID=UPI000D37EB7E|nr:MarR family transcriptional regulator [Paenisporosarcina sp. OV554]PUB10215.1 MarR family transcriptional regulator [Paenisporosarcina sp. OV554]
MDERKHLIYEFTRSFRYLVRTVRQDFAVEFEGYIPYNEFTVLRALEDDRTLRVSDVARRLNATNSYVTLTSEKLVQKGYIIRERSDTDRRTVYLTLTEAGINLVKQMDEIVYAYYDKTFGNISNEEMNSVINILKKFKPIERDIS